MRSERSTSRVGQLPRRPVHPLPAVEPPLPARPQAQLPLRSEPGAGLPAPPQTASNETILRLAQMKGTLCSTGLIACPFHLQLKRAAGPGPPFGDHVSRRQGQGYLFAGDGLKQPTADRSVDERRRDRPTARRLNMVVARSRADVVGPDAFVVGAHRVPAGSAEHDALEESRALARGPRPVVRAIGRQPLLDPEVGLPT